MSVPPSFTRLTPGSPGPAPLDQPQYDATIGEAAVRFWRKFAVFSGRASRSEYWWWALISFSISAVLQLVGLVFDGDLFLAGATLDLRAILLPLVPALAWALVVLIPSIALAVRRLHDTNRSGWWYLLVLPSHAASAFLLVGVASLDIERLAVGDLGALATGPLVAALVLALVGSVANVVLLVFFVLDPDPRGARFDRRPLSSPTPLGSGVNRGPRLR